MQGHISFLSYMLSLAFSGIFVSQLAQHLSFSRSLSFLSWPVGFRISIAFLFPLVFVSFLIDQV
ncbi:hypothetical protein ASPTUDRAFT_300506 [Aspergillus tubingensis CBS 134.48]|uniref:Uncharacterized protein n=1 Tax=Aspergillus tubingensis (strain CBS 134.48) TaxID=767770 RepID=A0A1L9NQ46_ASPTC|nr:hypothetical protein ASPTUDRAFT_300506 [Aspergillus tubingensis CBS 134.48]